MFLTPCKLIECLIAWIKKAQVHCLSGTRASASTWKIVEISCIYSVSMHSINLHGITFDEKDFQWICILPTRFYHHAKGQIPNFQALNLAESNTLGRKKIRKSLNRFFSLEASMPKNGRWLQKWVPFLNGFFYVRTLRHFFIWRTTLGGGDGDFWRRTSRPLCLLLWRKRLKGWRQDICP